LDGTTSSFYNTLKEDWHLNVNMTLDMDTADSHGEYVGILNGWITQSLGGPDECWATSYYYQYIHDSIATPIYYLGMYKDVGSTPILASYGVMRLNTDFTKSPGINGPFILTDWYKDSFSQGSNNVIQFLWDGIVPCDDLAYSAFVSPVSGDTISNMIDGVGFPVESSHARAKVSARYNIQANAYSGNYDGISDFVVPFIWNDPIGIEIAFGWDTGVPETYRDLMIYDSVIRGHERPGDADCVGVVAMGTKIWQGAASSLYYDSVAEIEYWRVLPSALPAMTQGRVYFLVLPNVEWDCNWATVSVLPSATWAPPLGAVSTAGGYWAAGTAPTVAW
jgi:hypothetical protein